MTIYLDIVLVENLCMNYIILFASAYILKKKVKHIRLIISALIGGIYSILAYVQILQIYSNIICKFILSIVMVYIAYKPKSAKELARNIIFFYLISFVFGGTAFALLYFVKPQEILIKNGVYVGTYPLKIAVLGGIVGFTIMVIAMKCRKVKLTKKDRFCKIYLYVENKCVEMTAILDTGNMLKDPISNRPVIIVEKEKMKDIFPNIILDNLSNIVGGDMPKELYEDENMKYITKFRVIPFKSIGKENGLLLGFKVNKVGIEINETVKTINDVIVGIYDSKLSKKETYSALIGIDILEGSEESEFITSSTR